MALVRTFEPLELERKVLHDEVQAKYTVYKIDGKALVQFNTYGRIDRQIPGKVSQSIQLDKQGAEQLVAILQKAFAL